MAPRKASRGSDICVECFLQSLTEDCWLCCLERSVKEEACI